MFGSGSETFAPFTCFGVEDDCFRAFGFVETFEESTTLTIS